MNDIEKILNMEKMLQDLNDAFDPIMQDMESNLKILQDFVGDKSGLNFNPITMEDISQEETK